MLLKNYVAEIPSLYKFHNKEAILPLLQFFFNHTHYALMLKLGHLSCAAKKALATSPIFGKLPMENLYGNQRTILSIEGFPYFRKASFTHRFKELESVL